MTTLALIPMLGMAGLVADLGYMHFINMAAQAAAEAAAKATVVAVHSSYGASIYSCTGAIVCTATPGNCDTAASGTAVYDGCLYAQQNGFRSAGNQNVTYEANVSSTPPTAPGSGTASYWVTFQVAQTVPQLFSAVLGKTSGLVAARSTAALVGGTDCIYALNNSAPDAISVSGSANLVSSCGLYDNSNNNCALYSNGSTIVSATEYDVVGHTCTNPLTPAPNTGVAPVSDPLSGLVPPASPTYNCNYTNYTAPSNGSTVTLSPGVYCGGINVKNNTYVLTAGTYILAGGGLTTQDSNSHLTGTGVMFYNTFGNTSSGYESYSPIGINANSTVNLSAPNSGTYAGILFFEDHNAPASSDTYGGGASAVYQGTIYAPHAAITMYGNASSSSGGAQYTLLIADTISLVGTTSLNNNYSSLPNDASPIQKVVVLE